MSVAISWANKMELAKCDIQSVFQNTVTSNLHVDVNTSLYTDT